MTDQLLQNYLDYEKAFWEEIIKEITGQLSPLKNKIPNEYLAGGFQPIVVCKDGLVSARFIDDLDYKFKPFNENKINAKKGKPPFLWVYNKLNNFSITEVVQLFTANSFKIKNKGKYPQDVPNNNLFPKFQQFRLIQGRGELTFRGGFDPKNITHKNIFFSMKETYFNSQGKTYSVYQFFQIDICGENTLKKLTKENGISLATKELNNVLTGISLKLNKQELISNEVESKIDSRISKVITEFSALIDNEGDNEQKLHEYITNNQILLTNTFLKVYSKVKLGSEYVTDFIIEKLASSGSESILVEIERANKSLFTKNGEPHSQLNHAIDQIRDWRIWIADNIEYAKRKVKSLSGDSKAMVIIGRNANLNSANKRKLKKLEKDGDMEILTYDDLIIRLRNLKDNLNKLQSTNSIKGGTSQLSK